MIEIVNQCHSKFKLKTFKGKIENCMYSSMFSKLQLVGFWFNFSFSLKFFSDIRYSKKYN